MALSIESGSEGRKEGEKAAPVEDRKSQGGEEGGDGSRKGGPGPFSETVFLGAS